MAALKEKEEGAKDGRTAKSCRNTNMEPEDITKHRRIDIEDEEGDADNTEDEKTSYGEAEEDGKW